MKKDAKAKATTEVKAGEVKTEAKPPPKKKV